LTASGFIINERAITVKLPSARGQQGIADAISSARSMRAHDRRLGMDRPIARRDFLNGVAIAAGAIAGGSCLAW
jgi:hypothetical protein